MTRKHTIGFIGLGAMGSKLAGRLLREGYVLTVFNRSLEKEDELVARGASPARSPKELAVVSDVIITSVTDDNAVRDVVMGMEGAFAGAKKNTVFIDMSTISVEATREFSDEAKKHGMVWLDAPVLGSPKMAEDGEMPFVVGGPKETLEAVRPILEAIGKKIVWMGDSGLGQAAKLVHNLTCGISLVAYSEALVLGKKLGLSKAQTLEVLQNGAVASPLLSMKAEKFRDDAFEPTSAPLINMSKDLGLAVDAAKYVSLTLPVLETAKKLYDKAKESDLKRKDTSSIIKVYESE